VYSGRRSQLEARFFGGGQQSTVGQTLETRETAGLAVVADERVAKALVKKNAPLTAGEQRFFGFFESLRRHLPADGRKSLQEPFQAVSGFEILEQSAHQNSGTSKCGHTGHDFGIADDN
jgi:hypothetical protein